MVRFRLVCGIFYLLASINSYLTKALIGDIGRSLMQKGKPADFSRDVVAIYDIIAAPLNFYSNLNINILYILADTLTKLLTDIGVYTLLEV